MLNDFVYGIGGLGMGLPKDKRAERRHPGFYGSLDLLQGGHAAPYSNNLHSNNLPQILIFDTVNQEGLLQPWPCLLRAALVSLLQQRPILFSN